MHIAQLLADGQVEVLERLERSLRLGQDTFRRGRLESATMRAAVAILRDYRRLLDFYQVERVRTVATSAVREASNSDTLLDRVYVATGLDIEVISTSEESRLLVSAVRERHLEALRKERRHTLIADVGGGSTLLTLLKGDQIVASVSLPLGSIRILESTAVDAGALARTFEVVRAQVANIIAANEVSLPLPLVRTIIAVGRDSRHAAEHARKATSIHGLTPLSAADFSRFMQRCEDSTVQELSVALGISLADAQTLSPALLVYEGLLQASSSQRVLVSDASMLDGLLRDLTRNTSVVEEAALAQDVVRSAESLAEKYHVDIDHTRAVSEFSAQLFDSLQTEHGLPRRARLLLQVAGILHDVGVFIDSRAHHKHSYYIITNSEVFGLTRDELQTVALVSRYHRRSPPKASHVEFINLPREKRVVVSKLAALLRVADALDRSHGQRIREVEFSREGEDLIIRAHGVSDLSIERLAMEAKSNMFMDVFGMGVRLEEASLATPRP
ncbi:MAG: HD domain-containing protein [Pseudomonadota bacterium]